MSDGYSLPPKKARTSRRVGVLFLFIAAVLGAATIPGAVLPGVYWNCDAEQRCTGGSDATNLLPDETRAEVSRDREARRKLEAWVAKPGIRIGHGVLVLFEMGPLIVMFLGVGMALRRLGQQRRNALADALPWLRHASRAAILLAAVRLISPFLRSVLLYGGMAEPETLTFPINVNDAILLLLLAFAAYATIWALEAGIRAERELADFV